MKVSIHWYYLPSFFSRISTKRHLICFSFADFIQQKCLILDEDIPHVWSTIMNSMNQMPYDAIKYKPKSNNNSAIETSALNDSINSTNALLSMDANENEFEQYPMTL